MGHASPHINSDPDYYALHYICSAELFITWSRRSPRGTTRNNWSPVKKKIICIYFFELFISNTDLRNKNQHEYGNGFGRKNISRIWTNYKYFIILIVLTLSGGDGDTVTNITNVHFKISLTEGAISS